MMAPMFLRSSKPARRAPWTAMSCLSAWLIALGGGCGTGLSSDPTGGSSSLSGDPNTAGNFTDGNRDIALTSPLGKTSGEPNDRFDTSVVAVFDAQSVAELVGTVSRVGDLDVYLLGPLLAGDHLFAEVGSPGSSLDVSVALFDGEGRLTYANDDRGGGTNVFLDSVVDFVVRHDSHAYYLVVTHSAFAGAGTFTGTYEARIRLSTDQSVPPPTSQVLYLDFDGGAIDSPVLGSMTLGPFDAGNISPVYRGDTETVKEQIVDVFRQNFERFDVAILTSDDPEPTGVEFSTIYFGGFNSQAFGIAEAVDLYNADFCDDAVIFTDSFTLSVFSFTPTPVELGIAIGNVGSHEAGHLLGLHHTDDDLDLMDDRSPADAFVADQEFKEAPLSTDIMDIGTQDGVLLLGEIVGLLDTVTARLRAGSHPPTPAGAARPLGGKIVRRVPSRGR